MNTAADVIEPLLLLSDTRRTLLEHQLRDRVIAWSRHWSTAAIQPVVEIIANPSMRVNRFAVSESTGYKVTSGASTPLRMLVPATFLVAAIGPDQRLGAISHESPSRLTAELLDEMLRSLADELLGQSGAQERSYLLDEHVASQIRPTGQHHFALVISFANPAAPLLMELSSSVVEQLVRRPIVTMPAENMSGRLKAVEEDEVHVEAILGNASVSLAELTTLMEGDVIVLDELLSQHGYMQTDQGVRFAEVSFGRVEDSRAVRIASPLGNGISHQ
jgi:flagellar motor switch/type III secretory pathway protein FliN